MKNEQITKRLLSVLLSAAMLTSVGAMAVSCNRTPGTTVDTTTDGSTTTPGGESMDPTANTSERGLSVSSLKVNNTSTALGIDTNPVFSWTVSSTAYGGIQTAYRIRLSSTEEKAKAGEADIWDSGKVESALNYSVAYSGETALTSKTTYYWTVTTWDVSGDSVTSNPAVLKTGMFEQTDWQGEFITAAAQSEIAADVDGASWIWDNGANMTTSAGSGLPAGTLYFRSHFTAEKEIANAVLCFTADDYGDFYVNGTSVCSVPNQTDIWKTGNIVNVTASLVKGENVLAAKITNSSAGYAGLVAKLVVVYVDGTEETLVTDGTNWKLSATASDGWQQLSYDESGWKTPTQVVTYGGSPWGTQATFSLGDSRAAQMLRKEFTVSKTVTEAMVYICGLGYFELTINGTLADDTLLNPCNTQYNKTVLYRTFDVTSLIVEGGNAIGVELGNSFYNEQSGVWNWPGASWRDDPKVLLNLVIRYSDGTEDLIVTDTSWKGTTDGPTIFNSIYYGERYDARKEMDGWNQAGFNDSAWSAASKATAPEGELICQIEDPIRRTSAYAPSSIKKLSDGSYVVTVPEYVTGWAAITVNGANAGDTITITYSEKLNANGSVVKMGGSDGISGSWWSEFNIMTDTYICKGGESETFEPKFSYKGFNYFQIWNYPGELKEEDIVIYRVNNDVEVTGSFETSNELINALHHMMVISTENNLQGKPTDCPVWEKNGWLGDCNVMLQSLTYNFDMSNFLPNFVEIMEDCYEQYGLVPQMVPTADWGVADHYVWNSLYVFAVEELYDVYGMDWYVREQYSAMDKYATKILRSIQRAGWLCGNGQLGDWVSPMGGQNDPYSESPNEGSAIVGTAYLYKMYTSMAKMAELVGETTDATTYRNAAASIKEAFNEAFYNEKGYYETGYWSNIGPKRTAFRQTSQLVALSFGLVPEDRIEKVVESLVNDIIEKGYHLDTGCVGAKEILPVLCDYGYADVAYRIATQTTYPSWGFMLEQGSTSLWEMWETTARSLGHYFLGSYDEWFYSHLAGVKDETNGFETYTVDPYFFDDLSYVTCTMNTVRGTLESSWTKENGTITMNLTVPYGSTATVYFPEGYDVTLGGVTPDASMNSIQSVTTVDGRTCIVILSGSYTFTCTANG
ncbi:MAG: family 78 glycoside hydrolase catalytic domain [Eubacteriales bacterium]